MHTHSLTLMVSMLLGVGGFACDRSEPSPASGSESSTAEAAAPQTSQTDEADEPAEKPSEGAPARASADPAVVDAALAAAEKKAGAALLEKPPCSEMSNEMQKCVELEKEKKFSEAGECYVGWVDLKLVKCQPHQQMKASANFRRAGDDEAAAEQWKRLLQTGTYPAAGVALADWNRENGRLERAGVLYNLLKTVPTTDPELKAYAEARCSAEEITCEFPSKSDP